MADSDGPAPGLVASTLLTTAEAHDRTLPMPVETGVASIDHQALSGGFRHGEITSIAGANGTGKTLLTFQAIATDLLGNDKGEVALIDTTGSFSPMRLREVILSRLLKSRQPDYQQLDYVYQPLQANAQTSDDVIVEEATSLLDHVKVMRVFDFAGVIEAISEIGEMWEREIDCVRGHLGVNPRAGDTIIDNSEEDEAGLSDENENATGSIQVNSPSAASGIEKSNGKSGHIGMIVIDTMTNVVSSMISGNQVQGQALLTSFMRSLHHLTIRRHICTLLVNSAVGLNSSSNSNYPRRLQDNASIFDSVMGKPALGKIYKHHIDTSIFLSSIPKTREDAEIAFGGAANPKWKTVNVLEVLSDRHGDREGQWASFEIDDEVGIINIS